ncbi:MAG: MarR family transcriptional regulator [Bryobacteraceae bacterium]|jgi:DNA-binding MarR family transcriptional regulator
MARLLTQLYDSHLRSAQIEASQFTLLSVLDGMPACNQQTLGRMMGFDKTTLSRNLKRLEQRGWIEASAGKNRRERGFVLTDGGRERLAAARPAWSQAQQQLQSTMSASEWSAMWEAFRSVTRAAGNPRK